MGKPHSIIKTGVALVLITELVLTQLAISSPNLHHWLHGADHVGHCAHQHNDSNTGQHEDSETGQQGEHVCAISLMAAGISSEEGSLEIHPSTALSESLLPFASRLAGETALARPQARGPPHLLR